MIGETLFDNLCHCFNSETLRAFQVCICFQNSIQKAYIRTFYLYLYIPGYITIYSIVRFYNIVISFYQELIFTPTLILRCDCSVVLPGWGVAVFV